MGGGGAEHLHVVDLDGARAGAPREPQARASASASWTCRCSSAAGCALLEAIDDVFEVGVARAILGTAAFTDPELLEQALGEHGPGGFSCRWTCAAARSQPSGWTETIDGDRGEASADSGVAGCDEFVYTNVDRDGMLDGPDLEDVRERRAGRARRGLFVLGRHRRSWLTSKACAA